MTEQTPIKRAVCRVVYKTGSILRNNFRCGSWFLPIVGIFFIYDAIFNIFNPPFLFPSTQNIIFNLTNILISIFFTTGGAILVSTKFCRKEIKLEDYVNSKIIQILLFITFIPTFTCIGISLYLIGINIKSLIFSVFITLIMGTLACIFIYLLSWCPKINKRAE